LIHKQTTRLAAVGDLHVKKTSDGALRPLLAPVNDEADMLLLCGDLTDYGVEEEAVILARELKAAVRIPIVAVLGNHDYESGQSDLVCRILTDIGVRVLNGETCEIDGIGIAGAKGFSVAPPSAPGANRQSSSSCARLWMKPSSSRRRCRA
jgi:predicted MPP superfamily phosphohydrolase